MIYPSADAMSSVP